MARAGRRRADVEERESAGAVGRFDHAGSEAALADQRRLLVAGQRGDRDRRAEQFRRGRTVIGTGIEHLRQDRRRDVEGVEESGVPGQTVDVIEHRARGVGYVGRVTPAAGEPPQQKAVDGAEGDLAGAGAAAQTGDIVEQPADLAGAEIGIDDEAGALRDGFRQPLAAPVRAQFRGAPVLPDDRVMDRAAGGALPQDRGLALVGDADRGDRTVRGGGGFAAGGKDAAPDLLGIMLDPARLRVELGQFDLRGMAGPALRVEQDRAGAGRSLVDRQDIR